MNSFSRTIDFKVYFGFSHQSTKFRFIVENVVVSIFFCDASVISRNRWTLNSDFTLVSSAHSYSLLSYVFNTNQRRRFYFYLLENDVFSFWQFYWHQLINFFAFFDKFRIFLFANFTKKFLEIVKGQPFNLIFFNLRLVPFLKAAKVNHSTRTWAFARTTKKLAIVLPLLHHTVLTLSCLLDVFDYYSFVFVENTINKHDFWFNSALRTLSLAFYRRNKELLLPQSNKTALFWIIFFLLILYPMLYWF